MVQILLHEETKSQSSAFRVKHCPEVGVWNISPSNLLQLAVYYKYLLSKVSTNLVHRMHLLILIFGHW